MRKFYLIQQRRLASACACMYSRHSGGARLNEDFRFGRLGARVAVGDEGHEW